MMIIYIKVARALQKPPRKVKRYFYGIYASQIDDTTKPLLWTRLNHFITAMASFNSKKMCFVIAIYCFIFIPIVCRDVDLMWNCNSSTTYLR